MKNLIFILSFLFVASLAVAQSVGINTTTPDASAALDVSSSNQGVLVPRMTESDRNLIASPATGLLIYQTDNTPGFYFYNGTAWTSLSASSGGGGTSSNGFTHYVGELYGGGIVYYVWKDAAGVEHGLIASLTDSLQELTNLNGPLTDVLYGYLSTKALSYYNGAQNTVDFATHVKSDGNTITAGCILTCTNYSSGGFSDWYVPAVDEGIPMFHNQIALNKVLASTNGADTFIPYPGGGNIWTSTQLEAESSNVHIISLRGTYAPVHKVNKQLTNQAMCRCVRSF